MKTGIGAALVLASSVLAVSPSLADPPPPGAASCSGCHPAHASAASKVTPLGGRNADEMLTAMIAYRDGTRSSTVMTRIAKGFSDDELRAICAWLAAQK